MAEPDRNLLVEYGDNRLVCNPASHHHHNTGIHPNALTSRLASHRDMTAAAREGLTALLDFLCNHCGYTEQQRKDAALTLGYAENELEEIHKADLPEDDALKRTTFVAVMADAAIEAGFTVSDMDILGASEATLRQWEAHDYPLALGAMYAELAEIQSTLTAGRFETSDPWCSQRMKLQSALGKFYQCRTRLGVDPFTGRVPNVDLKTLDEFEAEHAA